MTMRLPRAIAVVFGLASLGGGDDLHPVGHDLEGLPVADRPMAVYAADPQHLLNRLHAALYIAELVPDEVGSALPRERREAGLDDAAFFTGKWYFGKRAGTERDRAVFGGDVRFSPLGELAGERAARLRDLLAALQTREQVAAVAELQPPLVRLLVQWDLLAMWWRCERDTSADEETLRAMARAIVALAQEPAVLAGLPSGVDALRERVAGATPAAAATPARPYFPADLLAGDSAFVEVDRDDKALFHAERSLRAVRVFVGVLGGRDAAAALVAGAAAAGRDGPLPEVEVGTEVALVLSLLGVGTDGAVVATPVVDEIRIRRIVAAPEPGAGGSSRDGMSHWVWLRSRASSSGAAPHPFRFVPDTAQAMFLEYGTLKHTTYFAQCALCHRLTGTGKQTPAGITSLGRYANPAVAGDSQTRLRRAEQQAERIAGRLRLRVGR